jgi:hypothetical protein
MSNISHRKEEEERIQLIKYQKIDEEKYDRENQIKFPADDASSYIPDIDSKSNRSSFYRIGVIFLVGLGIIAWFARSGAFTSDQNDNIISSLNQTPETIILSDFDEEGRYVMRNYDQQKPMSSFLPGLGGVWGVPMWAFYVNRGQGITAFGVDNKDGAIAKYNSAEKAYQQTPFTGFRTFLKGQRNGNKWEHMPFFPEMNRRECTRGSGSGSGSGSDTSVSINEIQREMRIGMNELEINELEPNKELETNILYFTLPEEEFPGLVRRVTIKNLNLENYLSLEVLDGLMKLEPSGIPNGNLDSMGRTMEAWMNVYNIHEGEEGEGEEEVTRDSTQPFFHISQGTADAAQVQIIKFGHFVVGYLEGVYYSNGTRAPIPHDLPVDDDDTLTSATEEGEYDLLPFIVDPSIIFDTDTSLVYPINFFASSGHGATGDGDGRGVDDLFHQPQGTTSRTPCAFTGTSLLIPPGGYMVLTSIYGHSTTIEEFLEIQSPKVRQRGYVDKKIQVARDLVIDITSRVETNTSSPILNKYIQQNFLDNVLRGGLPLEFGKITASMSKEMKHLSSSASSSSSSSSLSSSPSSLTPHSKIYHVYSRIHGDLERDYNFFNIDTTYFSQGPGNFRDVNQNRRIDVIHSPFINNYNIKTFLSFIQADGYNPLTVASPLFILSSESYDILFPILGISKEQQIDFKKIVTKSFRLGQLFKDMKMNHIHTKLDREEFVNLIVSVSKQSYAGQYAQNGFWTDHWTYTLDLIQSYLYVFPDREESVMFDEENLIPFFMSPAIVKTRSQKYVLVDNPQDSSSSSSSSSSSTTSQSPLTTTRKSVRVYNAVIAWGEKGFPPKRLEAMMRIYQDPNYVAGPEGTGGVWQKCHSGHTFTVTPITKLSMLAILKFSTLDPLGMGVEMEGGKPGWNDAMNGLPGLIGSEMSETYEMIQILRYVQTVLKKYPQRTVSFPIEFYHFIRALDESLGLYEMEMKSNSSPTEEMEFRHWNRSNTAREEYRELMIAEPSCRTQTLTAETLLKLLNKFEQKSMKGVKRALEMSSHEGISPTYFYYDCVEYETKTFMDNLTSTMQTIVIPKRFSVKSLPLFLEGLTHLSYCPQPFITLSLSLSLSLSKVLSDT